MKSHFAWALLILSAGCGTEAPAADGDAGPATTPDAGPATTPDAGPAEAIEPRIPTSTGACPDFSATGRVEVSPEGLSPRGAQLWISDAAAELDGPVVFYWHGAGSRPEEATYGLDQATRDAILAAGGMVIAPEHDPAAGRFPWYLTTGRQTDDLIVADELLACAAETVGVDPRRVHAIGMSAGGLHTTQMSFGRSSYLASVVTYSGGIIAGRPRTDEPRNRFAALMFHGGAEDIVEIQFDDTTREYAELMRSRGQLAIVCDHGRGHVIPTDAATAVWQFFVDHPWGADPSPYEAGLPASFPSYCATAP